MPDNVINVLPVPAQKTERRRALRTASKTVRNFTRGNTSNPLPDCIVANLDWLSFMADAAASNLPTPEEEIKTYGDIVLEDTKRGNPTFKRKHKIYYGGEWVGYVLSDPHNEKMIKPYVVKVEIVNHVLYSSEVMDVYQVVMRELNLILRNITRIDIAIDGCNRLPVFLNAFCKQKSHNAKVVRVGRANFDCKRQDKNFNFHNFKIGSSHKHFVVYNKSGEIDALSHKEYIRAIWEKNGLVTAGSDEEVWRCELRLGSQGCKQFADFDLQRALADPNYLLSIFRTAAEKFFEFRYVEKDGNITRAVPIDLFDFERMQVQLLEKIPRAKVEGAHKAKMGIHQDVKSLLFSYVESEGDAVAALTNIRRNLQLFNLDRWYQRKLPEWHAAYTRLRPAGGNPYADLLALPGYNPN